MLALTAATKVFLAAGPTDLRKGFDGLCALVEGVLQQAPLSGHVFLFANGQRTRVKVLVWDGSGLWLCTKKLGRGRFVWPAIDAEQTTRRVAMNQSELMLLLSGVDLGATQRRNWWRCE